MNTVVNEVEAKEVVEVEVIDPKKLVVGESTRVKKPAGLLEVGAKLGAVLHSSAVLYGGYVVNGWEDGKVVALDAPKPCEFTGEAVLGGHGGCVKFHVTDGVVDAVEGWEG